MIWFILIAALFAGRFGGQSASRSTDVEWPSGSYGLPKSKSGCPGNKTSGWNVGWRFQDMEDVDKSRRSSVSKGSQMDIKFIGDKKDIYRKFCMKNNTEKKAKYWPIGSYCIYKYKRRRCPRYMNPGWVKWDDENYQNTNKAGGSLPHGSYNKDTVIHYCCQTSGNWNDVIELPVSQPFYLLTSNSNSMPKCQMVKWAFSYLEYIIFDTNDQNNADEQEGEHIFLEGRKLYYCYYKDCRRKFSGPSGSFKSHPISGGDMDPHSQYCSWLITNAESYVVSLNFKELTIPNCDDMFLKIYDGLNDTAPLLGTYCGSNATKQVKISSSANHLYIVSNSGRYGTNPKSPFSFHVQYNAEHAKRCHYEVMNNTGYLKSPKFATPKDYPHHSNCTWLVSVNDAYLIVLNVSFLKLHDNDVIEVYDGNNESSTVLARYLPLNTDRKNGSLVSSSSMVYIILKYGKPHNESTRFALNYISQPKPTTTVHSTPDRNKESAKQSKSNQTTFIIVAVVVTVVVVLILIVVIIIFRRRRRKAEQSTTLHSINPSYTWRKQARANDEDSECYANPSSPQEKIWVGNSKVCKEGRNPIYEPADGQEPAALYTSTENTYEPLVGNQGRAVESENPLYGVGDITASHVYAEPSSPPPNVYDEPTVKVSREARV